MLYFDTITTEALSLLKLIQQNSLTKKLRLVGGTALALQYGHRKSIDLDFFGKYDATYEELSAILRDFGKTEVLKNSPSIKVFVCQGIKVDFVNYPYTWIDDPVQTNDLILASEKDIGAMKLSAISGRGSKKDFYDLYFLLKIFSLKELLGFYEAKYHLSGLKKYGLF